MRNNSTVAFGLFGAIWFFSLSQDAQAEQSYCAYENEGQCLVHWEDYDPGFTTTALAVDCDDGRSYYVYTDRVARLENGRPTEQRYQLLGVYGRLIFAELRTTPIKIDKEQIWNGPAETRDNLWDPDYVMGGEVIVFAYDTDTYEGPARGYTFAVDENHPLHDPVTNGLEDSAYISSRPSSSTRCAMEGVRVNAPKGESIIVDPREFKTSFRLGDQHSIDVHFRSDERGWATYTFLTIKEGSVFPEFIHTCAGAVWDIRFGHEFPRCVLEYPNAELAVELDFPEVKIMDVVSILK